MTPRTVRATSHLLARRRGRVGGFTLIELMIVVALIAIAAATVGLAIRDPSENQLAQEAARLGALLESARSEARASGVAVRWELAGTDAQAVDGSPVDFRFVGLPPSAHLPTRWLQPGVAADIVGGRFVVLGPEPFIGSQRVLLRLENQRLTLATDGLAPFGIVNDETIAATR